MKNKNKKPLPTYDLGGFFTDAAQAGLNGLKFVGNNVVQTVGGNRPFDYTGAGRHEFDKLDKVASPIYGAASAALPMAANAIVPGSGAVVSLAQQGIGAATQGLQVRAEGGYNTGHVNLNAFVAGAPLLSNFPNHAMGGTMQEPTNSNMLTNFPTGGTHEENPMGGINLGNRGLVEEGETKAPLDKGDYIFSDRLKPKGSNKTFAQLSKSIYNKYKDRENDAAATRAMKADLEKLAKDQEAFKAAKQAKIQGSMDALSNMGEGDMFMHGGKLKPYSKFMFPDGGKLPQYGGETTETNYMDLGPDTYAVNSNYMSQPNANTQDLNSVQVPEINLNLPQSGIPGLQNGLPYDEYLNNQNLKLSKNTIAANPVANKSNVVAPTAANKVAEFKNTGYPEQHADPWIPLAQSAGDIFALAKSQKPVKDIKLAKYNPELMDYSREREMATKQAHMANQIAQANIRRNASSSGQALSNTVANSAANNTALMNVLSQSNQNQENVNKQLLNQAQLTNNATSNQEQDINMRNKAQLAFMQQQALTNIGANIANFGVDQKKDKAQNNYNQMVMSMANNPDYKLIPDGKGGFSWLYTGKSKKEDKSTKK